MQNFNFLTENNQKRLKTFQNNLEKWQNKINLISPKTIPEIWERHILDSAQLYPLLTKEEKVIVDIGTGAGFPGLVLAIIDDENRVYHLIESDHKKCVFLEEVGRILGLKNICIHCNRIENVADIQADILTARALTDLDSLLKYSINLLKPDGRCLFLKGRTVTEEISKINQSFQNLKIIKHPSHLAPDSYIVEVLKK